MLGLALLAWIVDATPSIDWRAPAGCPDAAEVERRARRLGASEVLPAATGDVAMAADGTFTLELTLGETPPHRYVAHDCGALADVAALVLAVASDPVAVVRTEPPTAAAPTPEEPPLPATAAREMPSAASASAPAVATPRRARPPFAGFVGVHGLFGSAELPRFDAGVGVAIGLGAGLGRFELHGAHLFARSAALPGTAKVVLASWNVSPRGCAVLGRRSVRAALCAGIELGVVTARGRGFQMNDSVRALWVAALAAPGLEWAIVPWLRLHAGVELIAAVRRPQFAAVENPDERVTLGAGGLRATLGVAGHFGPGAISGPEGRTDNSVRRK